MSIKSKNPIYLIGICASILFSGCVTDSNENEDTGFPNVAGKYSIFTQKFTGRCSDGTSGEVPAFSTNLQVNQSENELTIEGTQSIASNGMNGLTITNMTPYRGNINRQKGFSANRTVDVKINQTGQTGTYRFYLNGSFNSQGWSGDVNMELILLGIGTCSYSSTFRGDKV